MIFKGIGLIWNPKKKKPMVNFKDNPEYETSDEYEISILSNCASVECISFEEPEENDSMTKKEIMDSLDASGIDYNPRDKKEVLKELLEG